MADDDRRAEIEAATDALLADSGLPRYGGHRATIERRMVIAFDAADRVRDARDDDEAAYPPDRLTAGEAPRPAEWEAWQTRSPQGEDHEAGIPETALDAAEQAVHACRHYALGYPSRRALYVDARDEAYDVLVAALPHLAARSPQGKDHEAGDLAGDWRERAERDARGDDEVAAPMMIAAWVREQAEDKDYGTACEWRNVADAIEREAKDRGWRCECGDLNRDHEAFCYRCGAGPHGDHD